MFVIDTATNSGNPSEMQAIDAFNDELHANGHWVVAAGIGAPTTASVFDFTPGNELIKQGSLFKEEFFYSGFWIIEAENAEAAKQLAAKGSRACNRRVELRPIL
jgi:hypothetical protein